MMFVPPRDDVHMRERIQESKMTLSELQKIIKGENISMEDSGLSKREWNELMEAFELKDKLMSLENLKTSSTGSAYMDIIKSQFFRNERIKNNFLGYAHDRARAFTGPQKGLTNLMKLELGRDFFDLNDPCHCLNETVEKSIKQADQGILQFIEKTCHHFA